MARKTYKHARGRKLSTRQKNTRKKLKYIEDSKKKVLRINNNIKMLNDKIQILQNKIDEKLLELNKENDHLNYYQRELSYSDLEKM